MLDYKILYQEHYFDRELFLLEIDGKHTYVYRGSGLNGGSVGAVLPFSTLMDRKPRGLSEIIGGLVPGYIFKEFYYKGWRSHGKNMEQFPNTLPFLRHLEETLPGISEPKDQDFENVIEIAKEFNTKTEKLIGDMEPFDWSTL